MTSIWQGDPSGSEGTTISGDNTYKSEYFVATQGQTIFGLTKFAYAVGAESIQVFINGVEQTITKDYIESSGTSITLLEGADVADLVKVRALIGSENSQSAAVSAANAAVSAQQAQDAKDAVLGVSNVFIATSATNNTIDAGPKSFDVGAGKQFQNGQWVMAAVTANPIRYMVGQVTSYVGGILTINVTKLEGAGTFAGWNVSLTGVPQPVPAATNIFTDLNLLAQVNAIALLQ
jgi:hypothetical protein